MNRLKKKEKEKEKKKKRKAAGLFFLVFTAVNVKQRKGGKREHFIPTREQGTIHQLEIPTSIL